MDKQLQSVQKKQKSCPCCNKKLMLTDMVCNCGIKYCSLHRLPETHNCSVDYKKKGLQLLAEQLEKVVGKKVETF